ncbi:MAG: GGDEF domain-containing protein, partial [Bryobacterales bacterium]|nr:GGDEF domain-containing protein [Bryobacterales bacterium]
MTVYDGERRRHFDERDGLVWNDTNQNAFWADADGSVWIGTSRGASRVRLRETLFEPRELEGPRLVISSLRIGGQRYQPDPTSPLHSERATSPC